MKRLLLFIFFLVNCLLISAGTSCHTSGNYDNVISYGSESSGKYRVRVFFHIVRDGNGGGVFQFPLENIPLCIQRLNSDYRFATTQDVSFDYAGMDYIDQTDFYNITSYDSFEAQLLFNTQKHSNAIDVYLLPTESSIAGYANGIPGTALAIGGNYEGIVLGSSSLLSHEVGHCLGLFHTFHGGRDEPYNCPEYVGSNTYTCGDYVPDTEADPFRLYDSVVVCAWFNNTQTDPHGRLYMPNTRQIMTDVPAECMSDLTLGQGERVKKHLFAIQDLQDRLTSSIMYVQDQNFAGNGEEIVMARDSVIAGYNVTSRLNGNVVIPSGGNVTFTAGKKVILKPGFKVNLGAKFIAKINTLPSPNNVRARNDNVSEEYMPLLDKTSWTKVYYTTNNHAKSYVYKNVGDSILNGKQYRVIRSFHLDVDDPSVLPAEGIELLYEDKENKRVYCHSDFYNSDLLLYDFSIQVGDRLPCDPILIPSTDFDFVLQDISFIENSGYTRKQYTFVYESDSIVWVEGIGNYNDFTRPHFVKNDAMRLLCVQKEDETIYDTSSAGGKTCDEVNQIYKYLFSHESIPDVHIDTPSATKLIRDGQIFILRDDNVYTITGQRIE